MTKMDGVNIHEKLQCYKWLGCMRHEVSLGLTWT